MAAEAFAERVGPERRDAESDVGAERPLGARPCDPRLLAEAGDPRELQQAVGEPRGACGAVLEGRGARASDTCDRRVRCERCDDLATPVRPGDGVVVDEGDDRRTCAREAPVARPGEPGLELVDVRQRPECGPRTGGPAPRTVGRTPSRPRSPRDARRGRPGPRGSARGRPACRACTRRRSGKRSLRGPLRREQRIAGGHDPIPSDGAPDIPAMDDAEEWQPCLDPAWDARVALDPLAKELATRQVLGVRVLPVPERARVDTPQEARLAMELDRPAERELRAENPVLADVPVPEPASVPRRPPYGGSRRRPGSSCSGDPRGRRGGGSGRRERRRAEASARGRRRLPSRGSSSRTGRSSRPARVAPPFVR